MRTEDCFDLPWICHFPTSLKCLMLCTQDTVVGFLMAGVGNVDIRRKTNYLIVDSSTLFFFVTHNHLYQIYIIISSYVTYLKVVSSQSHRSLGRR